MNLEEEFECYSAIVSTSETLQKAENLMASDISLAVRTASNGIDLLKKLAELAVKTQNVELQEGILEVREQLLEVRKALVEAKEENFNLLEENKEMKRKVAEIEAQTQKKLVLKDGLYYAENDDVPFCAGCYDSKGSKIHLKKMSDIMSALGKYQCPICKTYYPGE